MWVRGQGLTYPRALELIVAVERHLHFSTAQQSKKEATTEEQYYDDPEHQFAIRNGLNPFVVGIRIFVSGHPATQPLVPIRLSSERV